MLKWKIDELLLTQMHIMFKRAYARCLIKFEGFDEETQLYWNISQFGF